MENFRALAEIFPVSAAAADVYHVSLIHWHLDRVGMGIRRNSDSQLQNVRSFAAAAASATIAG